MKYFQAFLLFYFDDSDLFGHSEILIYFEVVFFVLDEGLNSQHWNILVHVMKNVLNVQVLKWVKFIISNIFYIY